MRRAVFPVLFLAVSLAAAVFGPARAADSSSGDPFTVSRVKVDASAASSTEAYNIAINGGRRKAWSTLLHRLTPESDLAKVPAIDDATLQRMIRGYRSPTSAARPRATSPM